MQVGIIQKISSNSKLMRLVSLSIFINLKLNVYGIAFSKSTSLITSSIKGKVQLKKNSATNIRNFSIILEVMHRQDKGFVLRIDFKSVICRNVSLLVTNSYVAILKSCFRQVSLLSSPSRKGIPLVSIDHQTILCSRLVISYLSVTVKRINIGCLQSYIGALLTMD